MQDETSSSFLERRILSAIFNSAGVNFSLASKTSGGREDGIPGIRGEDTSSETVGFWGVSLKSLYGQLFLCSYKVLEKKKRK